MKTYIFSNCKKTSINAYANSIFKVIKVTDRIIVLNKGTVFYQLLPKYKAKLEKYKDIHTFHRNFGIYGIDGYFGLSNASEHRELINSIITFNRDDEDFNTAEVQIGYRETKCSETKQVSIPWLFEYHKVTKKLPTTGYVAYYLVQQLFNCKPEDIVLVNFYGNNDNSTAKAVDHDWKYENQWLKKKNRIFL